MSCLIMEKVGDKEFNTGESYDNYEMAEEIVAMKNEKKVRRGALSRFFVKELDENK